MKRVHSELFAPYRCVGVVTGDVRPAVRTTFVGKKSTLSILCPVDNLILQYNAKKLRLIGTSNPFSERVTAVIASSSSVFAAHGKSISELPFCRDATKCLSIQSPIKMMLLIGDTLVAVDEDSGIQVVDTVHFTSTLYLEGGDIFEISAMVHPSTYLNKVLLGSTSGRMRLVNVRTGKVIHEFQKDLGSAVTILKQSTALDVIAVGLASGKVLLYNIKIDKILHSYCHDAQITDLTFRDDGEPTLVTADKNGTMAIWNLEKQELIGKITNSHSDNINCLHFVPGEPIMVSASIDNSLCLWIFDGADGLPRELVRADGHRLDVTAVHFLGKKEFLTAGKDGAIRKYDVSSSTMRQKLGSVESKNLDEPKLEKTNVVDIVVGWQREAAWTNVFCRQNNDTKVTTWQTRNNTKGSITLEHERFKKNADYVHAVATALCLSPCGNSVVIGYSTGHIDQFNAQSGRFVGSFSSRTKITKKKKTLGKQQQVDEHPASADKITSLSIDKRGKELMSTDGGGCITFWSLSSRKATARLHKPNLKLGLSSSNPVNSLIAVVSSSDSGDEVIVLIDSICHRPVREFTNVGKKVNAMEFSSDGKWLLVADNDSYIRVYDISTSHMIDVILFSKPCVSLSFNGTGEYLATVHEGERAAYIWANKALFLSHVNIRALDPDFLPTWESRNDAPDLCIDDDDDTVIDDETRASREIQIDTTLMTFSGLPPSRWANLPDLSLIKDRNRPSVPIKKIKQAPFFLSAAQTLDGFDFQQEEFDENTSLKSLKAKRNLLELEGSFSTLLKHAKSNDDLFEAFQTLRERGLSYTDFQIRALTPNSISVFLRMLLEVLKNRKEFEIAQSYLTTVMKVHREYLWKEGSGESDLSEVLEELSLVQESHWTELEMLFVENMAIVQWIKNALL